MPGRSEPTAQDLRACYALVGECRDLGFDCRAWQGRAAEGLCRLLGAQVTITGNFTDFVPGRQARSLWSLRVGWAGDRERRAWESYVADPWEAKPEFPRLLGMAGAPVLATRDALWGRDAWYRSSAFNDRHRAAGIDDYIMSIRPVGPQGRRAPTLSHSLWVHRAVGDRPFGPREEGVVSLFHGEVAPLVGTALASPEEPAVGSLTVRRRQVLSRLLAGDSEKQIALSLSLSRPTVHDHVSALYRHFGASSRAELMARFVGRSAPCAETEAPLFRGVGDEPAPSHNDRGVRPVRPRA